MRVYITSFQLLNFQSWDNKTREVEIASDIVNIIEGANETGKSVLYKVMYNMCFPGYWDAKELIRRGYQTACLFLKLSDGSVVGYELSIGHHAYYLGVGEDVQKWSDCPIPEQLVEHLGLILDYDAHVILNIIDKDVPLPFIKTSPKFNASLIRAIVEPAKITDFFSRTGEHLKEVDAARSVFRTRMNAAQEAVSVLDYKDVDVLRAEKYRVDQMIQVAERFASLQTTCNNLVAVENSYPQKVAEPAKARRLVDIWDLVAQCGSHTVTLMTILGRQPQNIPNPQNSQELLGIYNKVTKLTQKLSSYGDILSRCPDKVEAVPDKQLLTVFDGLCSLSAAIDSCGQAMHSVEAQQQQINALAGEIQEIKNKVGVCPTCGRLL